MALLAALTELAARLTDAGIPTSIDPATVQPPGAWLHATSIEPITLDLTGCEVRATVYLVSRDLGTLRSLETLEQLLATLLEVGAPAGAVETDAFVATRSGNLPAFAVPITLYT